MEQSRIFEKYKPRNIRDFKQHKIDVKKWLQEGDGEYKKKIKNSRINKLEGERYLEPETNSGKFGTRIFLGHLSSLKNKENQLSPEKKAQVIKRKIKDLLMDTFN